MCVSCTKTCVVLSISLFEGYMDLLIAQNADHQPKILQQLRLFLKSSTQVSSTITSGDICQVKYYKGEKNKMHLSSIHKCDKVVPCENKSGFKMFKVITRGKSSNFIIPPVSTGVLMRNSDNELVLLKNKSFGFIHIKYGLKAIFKALEDDVKLEPGSDQFQSIKEHMVRSTLQLTPDERKDFVTFLEGKNQELIPTLFSVIDFNESMDNKKDEIIVIFKQMVRDCEWDVDSGSEFTNWTIPKENVNTLANHIWNIETFHQPRTKAPNNQQAACCFETTLKLLCSAKNQTDPHTILLLNALAECYEETLGLPEEITDQLDNAFQDMKLRFIDVPHMSWELHDKSVGFGSHIKLQFTPSIFMMVVFAQTPWNYN